MTRPGYSIDINLPSFYPDQKLLTEYVKELRDKFLDQADSSETRAAPYELDVTSTIFESSVPPRGTESLVLKTYENVGGAVPKTSYKAFNWDQAYRKAITYDNVWKPDTDPLPTTTTTTSRFYAPVALGIWCANWETGCDALKIPGHLAVLPADARGSCDFPDLPRYDVSWIADQCDERRPGSTPGA